MVEKVRHAQPLRHNTTGTGRTDSAIFIWPTISVRQSGQKCHIDIMRHTKTKIIIINNRPTLTLHKKLKLKYLIHIAVTSLSQ